MRSLSAGPFMSSPSTIDARRPAPSRRIADAQAARLLALGMLMAFAVFVQLDAVANRLTAGLPVSLLSGLVAGVPAATLLLLLAPGKSAPNATGSVGARLILLLMLWAGFCWTLSEYHREGVDYLIKLATAVGPALCLLVIVDRPAHLKAVIWAMIAAGIVSSAIVLIEAKTGTRLVATALAAISADFDGIARSSGGSDQNPTTAAQMLMTSAALALGLLFAGERRWRPVLVGAVAIGAAALALMSARSAILGFGAGAGIVLLSLRRHRAFPLILFGAAIVGAVGLAFAPATLWDRFAAVGDFGKDQTLFRRITYLRIGADLVQNSPIWGVGPGNFPLYYLKDAYRYLPGREMFPRELHNTYLDTATEYGLVGFAIFAALLVHTIRAARRGLSGSPALAQASLAVIVALVALLVACFFMPHKDLRYLWLVIALAIQCGRLRAGEARA